MIKFFTLIKLWILEYFKFCPLRKRNFDNKNKFLLIGHRGSPAREPENTIPSLQRAIDEGANGLEIDLCLTKDNKVILWHDWDPNETVALLREAGFEPYVKYKPCPPSLDNDFRRSIDTLTLAEVREHYCFLKRRLSARKRNVKVTVPTIEEFFEWAKDKQSLKYLFMDIKCPADKASCSIEMLRIIEECKKKYQPKYRIVIETTIQEVHDIMNKEFPDLEYCFDVETGPGIVIEPEKYSSINAAVENENEIALILRPTKATLGSWSTYRRILAYDINLRNKIYHNDNTHKKIIAATVNKRNEQNCLTRMGIDGIQTDFPGRLHKTLRRMHRELE